MFTTKLHTATALQPRRYFVDAFPGVGKTTQFIKLAAQHVRDRHNSVLVYAAPSNALINQVRDDLLAAGVAPSKITIVRSEKGSTTPVALRFQAVLVGSPELNQDPVDAGSIVLTTHECIARAGDNIRGKDRVALVYDEARACLSDNYRLSIPSNVYAYLTERQQWVSKTGVKKKARLVQLQERYVSGDESESDITYLMQWTTAGIEVPSVDDVKALLPKSTTQHGRALKIVAFLEYVRDSSIDVYVSVKKTSKDEYKIAKVFSPTRMFSGYPQVLILSAFFESSQMYHFLNDQDSDDYVRLENVTERFIDPERMERLLSRLQNVKITPIFDLDGNSLSKTAMAQAVVMNVDRKFTRVQVQEQNLYWRELHKKGHAPSYRSAFEIAVEKCNIAGGGLSKEAKAWVTENQHRLASHSVIQFMAQRVLDIKRKWQAKIGDPAGVKNKKACLGVNAKMKPDSNSEAEDVWKSEIEPHFESKFKQLPMVAHGLNKWKTYNVAAFLATMMYGQDDVEFLNRIVPGYQPKTDRTLDFALQVLFRIAARDLDSKEPCLFIVTDMVIAQALSARFQDLAKKAGIKTFKRVLDVVPPDFWSASFSTKKNLVLQYSHVRTAEERKAENQKRKGSVKGKIEAALKKEWSQTPEGRRWNNLSAVISQYKKAGKDYSKQWCERESIPKFSEWKRTPAGVKAAKKLTTTN